MYHAIQTLLLNPHEPRWKPAIHQKTPSSRVHLQSPCVLLNKPKSNKFSRQKCIKSVKAIFSVLSFVPLHVTTEMKSKLLKILFKYSLKKTQTKPNKKPNQRESKTSPPILTVPSLTGWLNEIITSSFQMQRD